MLDWFGWSFVIHFIIGIKRRIIEIWATLESKREGVRFQRHPEGEESKICITRLDLMDAFLKS